MRELPISILDEESLAGWLGVSRRTLRRWRQSRVGPPWIQIGSSVRYFESSVANWLAAQEVELQLGMISK